MAKPPVAQRTPPAVVVPAAPPPAPSAPGASNAAAAAIPATPAVDAPALAATASTTASTIVGRLELAPGDRQTTAAGEIADGLVYFLPKAGNPSPKPGRYIIETHDKRFSPSLLVIPVGSTVSFPNKDVILHNVFSKTPGSTFDLGTYGRDGSGQHLFTQPGLVVVNCNVHHAMRANIVVLATPYYARPDRAGRFELKQLPPGPGTLVIWHPRSTAQTVAITQPADAPVERRLVATKPRLDAAMRSGH